MQKGKLRINTILYSSNPSEEIILCVAINTLFINKNSLTKPKQFKRRIYFTWSPFFLMHFCLWLSYILQKHRSLCICIRLELLASMSSHTMLFPQCCSLSPLSEAIVWRSKDHIKISHNYGYWNFLSLQSTSVQNQTCFWMLLRWMVDFFLYL